MKLLAVLLLADVALTSCGGCQSQHQTPVPPAGTGGAPVVDAGTGGTVSTGGQAVQDAAPPPVCNATVTVAKSARARPKARKPRIVGGTAVSSISVWPWAVALETPTGDQFCGATLAYKRCLITAAHCEVRPGEQAVIGKLDLRQSGGRIGVREIRTHEAYRGVDSGNDVALLVLESTPGVTPVPLVDAGWSGPGLLAAVVGWGLTSEYASSTSPVLRETEVPLLAQTTCAAAYPNTITPTMLCAGYPEGGRDTCSGDSGGGLFVQINGWHLAASTSWGEGCARAGKPGVYANLAELREWLDACSYGCDG